MTWFQKSYLDFFKALTKNNTTAWFDQNRKTYESAVKKPFEAFTTEMIRRIATADAEVAIAAKDAMSRINRDTRFSTDKSPYNTHMSAAISKHGRKNKEYPGSFFQLSPTGVEVFGGAYAPEPATLAAIRACIAADPKGFAKVVASKPFVQHFGELRGETMKRIPTELQAAVQKEPRLAMKQFYYRAELPPALITSAELVEVLMAHWQAGRGVNTFLQQAFA